MDSLRLSPEDLLLTWCARVEMDEDTAQRIRDALSRGIDFDLLVQKSVAYDISPLLYWHLSRIDGGRSVPADVMNDLKDLYYTSSARSMILYSELGKILKAFTEAGIDTILLKGALLGEKIYGNSSLRPFGDLDLLVRRGDLHKIKGEMRKLGYRALAFPTELHERLYQEQAMMEAHYRKDGNGPNVDIHWDIQAVSSPLQIDIGEFWKRAMPTRVAGADALSLSPGDILLHLCLHLMEHVNQGVTVPLKWYCDIVEFLRHCKGRIDWRVFLESSDNFGIQEPVYRSLYTAKECFGATVPEEILDSLGSGKPYARKEYFIGEIEESGADPKKAAKPQGLKQEASYSDLIRLMRMQGYWNGAKAEGRWIKARLLLGEVFPSQEFMRQRYATDNGALIYLYYPVRLATAVKWVAVSLLKPVFTSIRARLRQKSIDAQKPN